MSVHILHAPPYFQHRYVPLLELVSYSRHSFPLLYHIIHLTMKKKKGEREKSIILCWQ
jgi:hypothetical protein